MVKYGIDIAMNVTTTFQNSLLAFDILELPGAGRFDEVELGGVLGQG